MYTLGLIEDPTTKSDVYFHGERLQVYDSVREYIANSERQLRVWVQSSRVGSTD